ncbi:beta-1,4-glucuronyltransferase 1-like [Branchiostoma floridae x Branchiostoma japonicum]
MSCSMINKFIIFLVGLIVVLQVVHITLLSRLDRDRGRSPSSIQAEGGERFSPREGRRLAGSSSTSRGNLRKSSAKLSKGSLDVSGQYRIHNFYIRSDDAANGDVQLEDATLVTQCSVQNLYHIVELSVRWDGPVSVAIFAPGENAAFADDIVGGLRRCYPLIRKYVSFHLVYPTSREAIIYEESPTLLNTPCQDILHLAKYHKSATLNYGAEKEPYPNNLLRNVARQGSSTEFIFVVDIDMLPSEKLRTDFVHFALENRLFDSRTSLVSDHLDTVYVVPAFELQLNASIPKDKTELLETLQQGQARPFYRDICWKCQSSTDYDKWTAAKSSSKRRLDVAYNVTWKDPWEPFYIGRWSVPLYDERFKQYGFNRISQVCELHIAGYGFSVLDRAFLVHKGWKTVTDFHASKDEENSRNRLLFRQFKNELKVKYPDTDRRCY